LATAPPPSGLLSVYVAEATALSDAPALKALTFKVKLPISKVPPDTITVLVDVGSEPSIVIRNVGGL
jgi:hypothetical protein